MSTSIARVNILLELLPELYTPAESKEFSHRLVSLIARLVPCWNVGFNEIDFLRGRTTGVVSSVDFDMERWGPIFEANVNDHPLIKHYQKNPGDTRVLRFCDVTTTAEFHHTGIYNEFFRPLGRPYQMGLSLRAGPQRVIGVGVSRGEREFTEEECHLLAGLRPHVLRAYQNAKALTHQRNILKTCCHALDRSNAALVAVENGHATLATPRAKGLLRKYFPKQGSRKLLPEELRQWVSLQLSGPRMSHSNAKDCATLPPLEIHHQGGKLSVSLLPGRHPEEHLLHLDEQMERLAGQLQSLGLTTREAEVAAWLARGKSNPEIAIILGMKARTVEKHLEHIYVKLGVENRLAATLQILRNPSHEDSDSCPDSP